MTEEQPHAAEPEEPDEHNDSGTELAKLIARGLAAARANSPTTRRSQRRRGSTELPRRSGPAQYSSARPDDRDPQTLDANLDRFVSAQGWETELQVHGVMLHWGAIVGPEVAAHTTPEAYAEGRLTVRTDSTAWATQLKLLTPQLVKRINEELGHQTVTVIDVLGPHTKSWVRGRLRVKGRGPRDTYG